MVNRVKDARYPDALLPVWRYHALSINSTLPTFEADIIYDRYAIVETIFADLFDGPLDPPALRAPRRQIRPGPARCDRAQPVGSIQPASLTSGPWLAATVSCF